MNSSRPFSPLSIAVLTLLSGGVGTSGAIATGHATRSPFSVERTEWGDPNLEGVWLSINTAGMPLQRPANERDDSLLRELVDGGVVEPGLLSEGVPPANACRTAGRQSTIGVGRTSAGARSSSIHLMDDCLV
jgi:hypothetical protein